MNILFTEMIRKKVSGRAFRPFITEMEARTSSLVGVFTPLSSPKESSASGAMPEDIVVKDWMLHSVAETADRLGKFKV